MDIETKITQLTNQLQQYAKEYYELDQPSISDEYYDQLYHELLDLENDYPQFIQPNSPTNKVGFVTKNSNNKLSKIQHEQAMGSLKNAFSIEDINEFENVIQQEGYNPDIIGELKLDGLAISLVYQNGQLNQAITRGDGQVGEDVTAAIMQIDAIPTKLNNPLDITVRGEIFMTKSTFAKLNEYQEKNGLKKFANPRNAASGTIRQLNLDIVKQRNLDFIAYAVTENDISGLFNNQSPSQTGLYDKLKQAGFKLQPKIYHVSQDTDYAKIIEQISQLRDDLDIPIDGIVFKVNDIGIQQNLGYVGKYPRFAIAYKFPAEKVKSKIESVDIQIGRTGNVTPVANISPVEIAQTIVSRATLHNFTHIADKDFRIGDSVIVQKAGEIIPEIVSVVVEDRTGQEEVIQIPQVCPICDTKLEWSTSGITLSCNNKKCSSKILNRIIHFCSRDAMNITGLGPKQIEKLFELGIIQTYADLYRLDVDSLIKVEKIKEKSAQNIINSIQNSKQVTFDKFIYSIGIYGIGQTNSKSLARNFNSIEQLMNVTKAELENLSDIGPILASNIVEYFASEEHQAEIQQLLSLGIELIVNEVNQDSEFSQKQIVVTGTFETLKRNDIKDFFEKNGAIAKNSVSSKTDYLVVGANPGSKLEKARSLNIEIIDEELLLKYMEEK